MADEAKKNNFVSRLVAQVDAFLDDYGELLQLRDEYDALDYGNQISQDDLQGTNADISPAEITAVFTSVAAVKAVMDAGHKTNLYRIVP